MGRKSNSKFPGRNLIFKKLRSENTTESNTDSKGNAVYLNLVKRILLDKPYINKEYERERQRLISKMNMSLRKGESDDN